MGPSLDWKELSRRDCAGGLACFCSGEKCTKTNCLQRSCVETQYLVYVLLLEDMQNGAIGNQYLLLVTLEKRKI